MEGCGGGIRRAAGPAPPQVPMEVRLQPDGAQLTHGVCGPCMRRRQCMGSSAPVAALRSPPRSYPPTPGESRRAAAGGGGGGVRQLRS
jgi:hypothetical protein